MTSVPKPLKFLRPHYPTLEATYEKWPTSDDKVSLTSTDLIEFTDQMLKSPRL